MAEALLKVNLCLVYTIDSQLAFICFNKAMSSIVRDIYFVILRRN